MAAYAHVRVHCSSDPAHGLKLQACEAATRDACMRSHSCSCSQQGANLFTRSTATRQCRAGPRPRALPLSLVLFTPSTGMPPDPQGHCAPTPLVSGVLICNTLTYPTYVEAGRAHQG